MFSHVGFFYWSFGDAPGAPGRRLAMVDTNILLVDDDKDTCAAMSDIFLDLGYTVDMA